MRFVPIAAILTVMFYSLLSVAGADAAARTVVCHGSSSNPPGTYSGLAGGAVRMNYVKAGSGPQAGLNPGECSWTASAIEPAAPTTLCASNVGSVSVAFTKRGDLYGSNLFNLIKATWLQRYYSDSNVLFALDVTANTITNCLEVQGDARDFRPLIRRVLPHPMPRHSGFPQ